MDEKTRTKSQRPFIEYFIPILLTLSISGVSHDQTQRHIRGSKRPAFQHPPTRRRKRELSPHRKRVPRNLKQEHSKVHNRFRDVQTTATITPIVVSFYAMQMPA